MNQAEVADRIVETLDIVQVVSKHVTLKKGGVNYFGCCPFHDEKTPSFSVSPLKKIFHCFGCGTGGNVITFLAKIEGKTNGKVIYDLSKENGYALDSYTPAPLAATKKEKEQFVPSTKLSPREKWQTSAVAKVAEAHSRLIESPERLAWLAARGLNIDTVKRFKLGWIESKRDFSPLATWGLKKIFNGKGNEKKVWLPKGYVLPQYRTGDTLSMIQVRLDELMPGNENMRYYPVKGSTVTPLVIPPTTDIPPALIPWVVVESRLDAYAIAAAVGDIVGVMALGSNSARPDTEAFDLLKVSPHILNALDFDKAGASQRQWWADNFPESVRWPTPEGGDPGEYVEEHSGDIREWILAGLPPGLRIERKTQPVQEATANDAYSTNKDSDAGSDSGSVKQKDKSLSVAMPTGCGREIHLTNSRKEYERLTAEGKLPFSNKEIDISKAFVADGGDPSILVDFKEIFGGRLLERIELNTDI